MNAHAALLTPPGPAAIAVVRVAGIDAVRIVAACFSKPLIPGRCIYGALRDSSGDALDDIIAVTATDSSWVDLNLHGGEWIVQSCLDLLRSRGAEIIDGIAIVSAAADEVAQEVSTHLPFARTERAVRLLLDQPRRWKKLRDEGAKRDELQQIASNRALWWLLHPPRIALVGIPNAGKSTLANQLFGQDRSIMSDVPGTTRDWVGEWTALRGLPVFLIDTPGVRASADPIEQTAIAQATSPIASASLIIHLLDPTAPLEPDQRRLCEQFPAALRVINKSDLPAVWDALSIGKSIALCATRGSGLDVLTDEILAYFDQHTPTDTACCWTQRQLEFIAAELKKC